jgi:hypothetical protein
MIARIWRGQTPAENARRYRQHAIERVFSQLDNLPRRKLISSRARRTVRSRSKDLPGSESITMSASAISTKTSEIRRLVISRQIASEQRFRGIGG